MDIQTGDSLRQEGIRVGDLVVKDNTLALLVKQTSKYYYFNYEKHIVRTSKKKLWRLLDTGKIDIVSTGNKRRKQRKDRTLDLHGTRHNDVDEKVRRFLNFAELPCTIITGKSKKMKEIVKSIVEEYGWHQSDSLANYGEIIIKENSK